MPLSLGVAAWRHRMRRFEMAAWLQTAALVMVASHLALGGIGGVSRNGGVARNSSVAWRQSSGSTSCGDTVWRYRRNVGMRGGVNIVAAVGRL